MGIVYDCCWEGIMRHGGIVSHCGGRLGWFMNSLKDQRVIGASNGVRAHETSRAARSGSDFPTT